MEIPVGIALIVVGVVIWFVWSAITAPKGKEDDDGFHRS